jgi:CDP-glucose 4,6-dehydratase
MKYLITGHTGFKGSWLSALLKIQGHEVFGISLNPVNKSHYCESHVEKYMNKDVRLDIREYEPLVQTVTKLQPDIIIHLAAKSLVIDSYKNPIETFETNLMGTLNLLKASDKLDHLKATLIITSDKVYKLKVGRSSFLESDPLGGDDPYSASKAMADLAAQSWRSSFGKTSIAIARAGNVIGGGDWSANRIVPDIVRALKSNQELVVRNLNSTRPWQHVLDCLNGYQLLVEKQINHGYQGEWNFGPNQDSIVKVSGLIRKFEQSWGQKVRIESHPSILKESKHLRLNSDLSKRALNWSEKLSLDESISWTCQWYKDSNPVIATREQITKFINL